MVDHQCRAQPGRQLPGLDQQAGTGRVIHPEMGPLQRQRRPLGQPGGRRKCGHGRRVGTRHQQQADVMQQAGHESLAVDVSVHGPRQLLGRAGHRQAVQPEAPWIKGLAGARRQRAVQAAGRSNAPYRRQAQHAQRETDRAHPPGQAVIGRVGHFQHPRRQRRLAVQTGQHRVDLDVRVTQQRQQARCPHAPH